jgi:hypothetical protein
MNSENRGMNGIQTVMASLLASAVWDIASNPDNLMPSYTGLKSKFDTTMKDKKGAAAKVVKFGNSIRKSKRNIVFALLGMAGSITWNVLDPKFSFQDLSKKTQITARKKKSRDAFVIEYVDRRGIEDVPMIFLLKLNKETKNWELFVERGGRLHSLQASSQQNRRFHHAFDETH